MQAKKGKSVSNNRIDRNNNKNNSNDKIDSLLNYLYGLERFGIKLGLTAIEKVLDAIGNPHRSITTVHVAGTNGKGSTCAYISSILIEEGYKVGLYTSPHLVRFNERIMINNNEISDDDIIELTGFIKKKLEEKNLTATFFEFTTALAFLYFKKKEIDIAVIEVGMGGRLDATNVITPVVCVITNVGFDHMEHLGKTIDKIAFEKAGIIKEGVPLITSEENPEALRVFRSVCKKNNSSIILAKKGVKRKILSDSLDGIEFEITGAAKGKYSLKMLGLHQVDNAINAILVSKTLSEKNINVKDSSIKKGLYNTFWKGRIQLISRKPLIIFDGAHNISCMNALKQFMLKISNRRILVIGISKDKEIAKMIKAIAPFFDEIIVTKGLFKPAKTSVIAKEARQYCEKVIEIQELEKALNYAKNKLKDNDTMLVTGSLYVVGGALSIIREKKF